MEKPIKEGSIVMVTFEKETTIKMFEPEDHVLEKPIEKVMRVKEGFKADVLNVNDPTLMVSAMGKIVFIDSKSPNVSFFVLDGEVKV